MLNADQRGGAGPNGKPSYTIAQAAVQLDRAGLEWNSQLGQAAMVTYAYRSTAPSIMPEDTSGFSRFTAAQITGAELSFAAWSDVANITFARVGSGPSGDVAYSNNATILLGDYAKGQDDAAAFTYLPGSRAAGAIAGDVWVASSDPDNTAPTAGTYGLETLTHELGHAIGLSHPSNYDAGDINQDITYEADASYYEDSREYSIMSYFASSNTGGSASIYAVAPQLDDIAAAQRLYGANYSTRTGNDVYGFNSNLASDGGHRPWYELSSPSDYIYAAVWDGGGNDTLDFSGFPQNQLIDLGEGNFSNVGGDIGNVAIAVGAKIENAIGGSGPNSIFGNALDNHLSGAGSQDTFFGGDGADTLEGGQGVNSLYGGDGADSIVGYHGIDFLYGGDGADRLIGGADARMTGGQGADTFVYVLNGFSGGSISDFETGVDKIDITALGATGLTYSGDTVEILGFPHPLMIEVDGALELQRDVLGLPGATLAGGASADTLTGGDGADLIVGGGGADLLTGGASSNTFRYLSASDSNATAYDVVTGFSAHYDLIDFSALNPTSLDIVTAGSHVYFLFASTPSGTVEIAFQNPSGQIGPDDFLTGQTAPGLGYVGCADAESIVGGAQADALNGGGGADTLVGGGGGDVLTGGAGADVFQLGATGDSTPAAPDLITDFQTGTDQISLGGLNVGTANVVLANGASFIFASGTFGLPAINVQINVIGQVNGSDIGGLHVNVIGSDAPELIRGSLQSDALSGGGGDDTLIGGSSADILTGGAGADVFRLEHAIDSLSYAPDLVTDFQTGQDRLELGAFCATVNILRAATASFVYVGGANSDVQAMVAATGDVNGSDLKGFSSGVVITAVDAGVHGLIGSDYSDTISGGGGPDVLIGGGGSDVLAGGDGSDIFKFLSYADSPTTGGDTITDFRTGIDHIDVSALHLASASLNYLSTGGSTYVFIDEGGAGGAGGAHDLIVLQHAAVVQMSDFVW